MSVTDVHPPRAFRRASPRLALALLAVGVSSGARAAPSPAPTRVVILGVTHSGAQLVSRWQQPAAFRAFIDRVRPDGICIERAPDEFARNDFYEFTFEQQDIVVPYARERRIPLHPIDWLPREDDIVLALGIDISKPPMIRPEKNFQAFETLPAAQLQARLFFAEAEASRREGRDWASQPSTPPRADFSRRLYLYRTFLQAMRIARAARQHSGGTLLVVIGWMHKDDIERILADQPGVAIVQPSKFGEPTAAEVRRGVRDSDRFAIATFNLLGLQSGVAVDWDWLRQIVGELGTASHEAQLFATRLGYLTHKLSPTEALARYEALERVTAADEMFHWNGVKDRSRIDSTFDPFGNLTVKQRIALEIARLAHQLGQGARAQQIEDQLIARLTPLQAAQLHSYWKPYVIDRH
jgi:hypothetical protein